MILNSAPQDQAVLSNVGQIGEFRIRNSAKAFSILSSGLYANKVRAIIRELSCNAIDSHVAAGNLATPFELHLPNSMEPHFSIRDFGTGLTHEQVTQIYTTYFESTKTASNDFIGALGLGSKSPFSYTDNFTVTAIKDGTKGIYTAFINESGVPSIALMMNEPTDEAPGVEIKFSVNDRYDFTKFRDEARQVFKFFKNRPVITGSADFQFANPEYKEQDIVPGIHSYDGYTSQAVMGNIAYPIDIPNADTSIGELRHLLNCGLVIEFGIGELDFQASREGLSYVPLTIDSIRGKLEALNAQLAIHLAENANKIDNLRERAAYLYKRLDDELWQSAVVKYVTDTQFPLMNTATKGRWNSLKRFELQVSDLASKYNIVMRGFSKSRGVTSCSTVKAAPHHDRVAQVTYYQWTVSPELDRYFVFNDTKTGALERAKYHWRNRQQTAYSEVVYVLEAADRTKPMNRAAFLADIHNPPAANIMDASTLMMKEREASVGRNVTILYLEERSRGYGSSTVVWSDAGSASTFSDTDTHYYLPLSGFASLGVVSDIKELQRRLKDSGIFSGTIYGVRKGDMEFIKTKANWINLDEMVQEKLSKLSTTSVMSMVKEAIGFDSMFHWLVHGKIPPTSPYAKFHAVFKDVKSSDSNSRRSLETLCRQYKVSTVASDPTAMVDKYTKEIEALAKRYPMLSAVGRYSTDSTVIAEYINMVDQVKPV